MILRSGDGPAPSTLVTGHFWEAIHPRTRNGRSAQAGHFLHFVYPTATEGGAAVARSSYAQTGAGLVSGHFFGPINEVARHPLATIRTDHANLGRRWLRFAVADTLVAFQAQVLRTRQLPAFAGLKTGNPLRGIDGGTRHAPSGEGVRFCHFAGRTVDGHLSDPSVPILRTRDAAIDPCLVAGNPTGARLVTAGYRQSLALGPPRHHFGRARFESRITETLEAITTEILRTSHAGT